MSDFSNATGYPKLLIDGEVVSGTSFEIDPLVSHTIGLQCQINNAKPGAFPLWLAQITVYDRTNNEPINYWSKICDGSDGGGSGNIPIGKLDAQRQYRIKLWATQNDLAGPVPEDYWD